MADIDKTLKYYNENAQSFASGTVSVKFTKVQDKFLEKLNPDAYILDFGCGAGRDTKYFLSRGYQVDAVDGSEHCVGLQVNIRKLSQADVVSGIG